MWSQKVRHNLSIEHTCSYLDKSQNLKLVIKDVSLEFAIIWRLYYINFLFFVETTLSQDILLCRPLLILKFFSHFSPANRFYSAEIYRYSYFLPVTEIFSPENHRIILFFIVHFHLNWEKQSGRNINWAFLWLRW